LFNGRTRSSPRVREPRPGQLPCSMAGFDMVGIGQAGMDESAVAQFNSSIGRHRNKRPKVIPHGPPFIFVVRSWPGVSSWYTCHVIGRQEMTRREFPDFVSNGRCDCPTAYPALVESSRHCSAPHAEVDEPPSRRPCCERTTSYRLVKPVTDTEAPVIGDGKKNANWDCEDIQFRAWFWLHNS
jgi:hypothetical protein